jgi:hypothetical protein
MDIKNDLKSEIGKQASMRNALKDAGGDTIMKFQAALSEVDSDENELEEKWSEKYKKSIDCNHPKGFSQKAHCQGKKKKVENKEASGAAGAGGFESPLFSNVKRKLKEALKKFVNESQKKSCKKCGKTKCICNEKKKVETKEATGASSSGSYVTPASWAKSTKKKDWRGRAKTQIPGGKFVTVKKKCKTFPYCNQGDIKALKIYENEVVKNVITKISKEQKINENVIKIIIQYEIENFKNNLNK